MTTHFSNLSMKDFQRKSNNPYDLSKQKTKGRKRLRQNHHAVEAFTGVHQSTDLLREVQWLWKHAGGDRVTAKSFWIGREDLPRCCLEAFAQECAAFHHPDYLGAEYWVQIRVGGEGDEAGLDLHYDKDEALLKEEDAWVHPHTSTVTYLTGSGEVSGESTSSTGKNNRKMRIKCPPRWGAPLVVFNTTSHESAALPPRGALPNKAWLLLARPGSHVKFTGNLLHGVPGELNRHLYGNGGNDSVGDSGCCYERTALPVNVWTHHQPRSVQRLPHACLEEMQQDQDPSHSFSPGEEYFPLSSLLPAPLLGVSQPALQLEDDLSTLDKSALPPDFDPSEVLFLEDHVGGSTGHVPLREAREVLRAAQEGGAPAGLQISYF